jgi:hypothetical protein
MITAHSTPTSQDPLLPVAGRDTLVRLTCDIPATSSRHPAASPGFPAKILEFYFPQLFVDLPADLWDRVGR